MSCVPRHFIIDPNRISSKITTAATNPYRFQKPNRPKSDPTAAHKRKGIATRQYNRPIGIGHTTMPFAAHAVIATKVVATNMLASVNRIALFSPTCQLDPG
jgi:hypothetical protein